MWILNILCFFLSSCLWWILMNVKHQISYCILWETKQGIIKNKKFWNFLLLIFTGVVNIITGNCVILCCFLFTGHIWHSHLPSQVQQVCHWLPDSRWKRSACHRHSFDFQYDARGHDPWLGFLVWGRLSGHWVSFYKTPYNFRYQTCTITLEDIYA